MSPTSCTRCHRPLPADPPREGEVYKPQLRRETTTVRHVLRFNRWAFRWMPADPTDRAHLTYTDFDLCSNCAVDLLDFAQGKETHR